MELKGRFDKIILKHSLGMFEDVYQEAVQIAKALDCEIQFYYEGVDVIVGSHSQDKFNSEIYEMTKAQIDEGSGTVYL